MFARRTPRPTSPASKSASVLALGFAVAAAASSVAGAWMISKSFGWPIQLALGGLSCLAVLYERSALVWTAARRERKDWRGARWGIALLLIAGVYTGAMQLTFFGSIMLDGVAKDRQAESGRSDLAKRINELETKRTWIPRPTGTIASLRAEVQALNDDSRRTDPVFRDAAKKAASALPAKRAELGNAEAYTEMETKLAELRAQLTVAAGVAEVDVKAAMFGGDHRITYSLIVLCVVFLQLGQMVMPVIAGKAELAAAQAGAAVMEVQAPAPRAPPAAPAPPTIEAAAARPIPLLAAPRPAGALALAVAERQKLRAEEEARQEAAAKAAKGKKKPAPAKAEPAKAPPQSLAARVQRAT